MSNRAVQIAAKNVTVALQEFATAIMGNNSPSNGATRARSSTSAAASTAGHAGNKPSAPRRKYKRRQAAAIAD